MTTLSGHPEEAEVSTEVIPFPGDGKAVRSGNDGAWLATEVIPWEPDYEPGEPGNCGALLGALVCSRRHSHAGWHVSEIGRGMAIASWPGGSA